MSQHPTETQSPEPSGMATIGWLIRNTSDLLPPLLVACILSCLTRCASLGIYLVATVGIAKTANISVLESLTGLSWTWLILLMIVLGLFKGALRYGEQYVGHKVAFLSLSRLRNKIFAAAEYQAPFDARSKNSGGLLAVATRDVDRVEVFFAHTLPPAVAAIVISSAVTWWTWLNFGETPALLLLTAYVLVGLVIPALGVKGLRSAASDGARVRGIQNQILTETLAGIDVVHGYASGKAMQERFNNAARPVKAKTLRAGKLTGLRSALTQIVVWGSLLGLVIIMSARGELPALLILAAIAVPSFEAVRTVDGFIIGLQDSLASAKRLYSVTLGQPQVKDPAQPQPLPETGTLAITNLGAAYQGVKVLENLGLNLEPGKIVALVGDSGSGKSTVASALVRAIPSTGKITFGAVNLNEAASAEVRSRIILVSQEAVMIRGSIRDNLLLGLKDISDEELMTVLAELGLKSWLDGQKQGLETRLGDRSTRLSGGQRQRLALARALVRKPAVLILDESTSALDTQSEQMVLAAINRRCAEGMAVLMISHRISILGTASEVIVLREGKVAETGDPGVLLADSESLFSRMAIREADKILPA
ncbi:ABC transporter ATP-binding protein [Glutamicibacter sp.]|uniref:amino acid ABC transporter ATP-binding/permease protein n=1 Tax=Glutamicibacter sp. TaxID=1931995 RepID=UPI0028BE6687|nr:ABC transporter ATP-binding protein [Glutamicibacter sp.]